MENAGPNLARVEKAFSIHFDPEHAYPFNFSDSQKICMLLRDPA